MLTSTLKQSICLVVVHYIVIVVDSFNFIMDWKHPRHPIPNFYGVSALVQYLSPPECITRAIYPKLHCKPCYYMIKFYTNDT